MQEIHPFIVNDGRMGGANSSCTYDRLAIAACTLADVPLILNLSIPIEYQVWGCVYRTVHCIEHARTQKCTHAHTLIPPAVLL